MAKPFTSERLVYRSIDPEVDEPLFKELQADPAAWLNSNPTVPKPTSKQSVLDYMKGVEESLLGVVVCLPNPEPSSEPTPIGVISLSKSQPGMVHHRFTFIGINILKRYQGKGFGSEAIKWSLEWAFNMAGMHRVGIRAAGYNVRARQLYERLGFKLEGITREGLWRNGRWWDDNQLGMLYQEWREKFGAAE
jgi:RimJ/RimL family protein N-acetyltransferase